MFLAKCPSCVQKAQSHAMMYQFAVQHSSRKCMTYILHPLDCVTLITMSMWKQFISFHKAAQNMNKLFYYTEYLLILYLYVVYSYLIQYIVILHIVFLHLTSVHSGLGWVDMDNSLYQCVQLFYCLIRFLKNQLKRGL